MKKILSAFLLLISFVCGYSQTNNIDDILSFGDAPDMNETEFLGFQLLNGPSSLIRFYEVHVDCNGSLKYTLIPESSFVYQAKGRQLSKANPKGEDWFVSYGIKDPNTVNSLWKLRYREYPYFTQIPQKGWSSNDSIDWMPSKAQFKILSRYGINSLQDFCYGYRAFLLLKDMEDPQWIENYKNASYSGDDTTSTPDNNNKSDDDFGKGFVD